MQEKWTSQIRNHHERKSPEQRADELRSRVEAVRAALHHSIVNRDLCLEAPEGGEALAKKIAAHNERAEAFTAKAADWEQRYAALPQEEARPGAKVAALVKARQAVLTEQVEVFAEHKAVLESRGELLGEVLAVMDARKAAAAEKVQQERERIDKALRKIGYSPEEDFHYERNPAAARIRHEHRISESRIVRDAAWELEAIKCAMAHLQGQLEKIPADVELVEMLRYEAVGEVAGRV